MFKTISTPELTEQVHQWGLRKLWLSKGYWLCVDPLLSAYGWVEDRSFNSDEFIELKELNQDVLTQLVLLHSIGLSPKEIAEILNE